MPSQLVRAVHAVHVVDSLQRKPEEYKYKSFFGSYDIWRYHAIFDVKLCDTCLMHAQTFYFVGKYLRVLFPYLEIVDANLIEANVHRHCRCELHRVTDPAEYIMVTAELLS